MTFTLRKSIHEMEMAPFEKREWDIKGDANEAYYTLLPEQFCFSGKEFNHYPDSEALRLREELGNYYSINPKNILLSNGSSQVLEMIFWSYCEPQDKVITFDPGFSMFDNYSRKADSRLIWIPTKDFVQDLHVMGEEIERQDPKVVLLCNPNNPTGYVNKKEEVLGLIKAYPDHLFLVDEAYGDFSDQSVLSYINEVPNLLVIKTLSKAMGLAGLRLGFVAGNESLIGELNKARLPSM